MPGAPSPCAQLFILSATDLDPQPGPGIPLTIEPLSIDFAKILKLELVNTSVTSCISRLNLKSGLSFPYFSIESLYVILGKISSTFFLENLLKTSFMTGSTAWKTSSCST